MRDDNHLPNMNPKKPRFNIFNRKEGKGIEKEDIYQGHDLKGFFISLKIHFSKLLSVNILMILGNFPFIFLIVALSNAFRLPYMSVKHDIFSALGGVLLESEGSSIGNTLTSVFAMPTEGSVMTLGNYIFFGLAALMFLTFGLVNVGTTYLLREMVRGNPVFILGDFWDAVKRNWKQGLLFGIFDLLLLLIMPINIYFFLSDSSFFLRFLFFCMLFISLIYFFMRFYIYLQMVTFDLPIRKILKNALIFSILNLKRNIMAFLGIILIVVLDFLFLFTGFTMPFAIALPLILLFALGSFMAMYAAYFKVEEIMVVKWEDDDEDTSGGSPTGTEPLPESTPASVGE